MACHPRRMSNTLNIKPELLKARKLLPVVRPDYIVVDVDETDLYDDFARYRNLIVRNQRSQNVGVKVHPLATNAVLA